MKSYKGGWWKRFCGFWESKKKRKDASNRMDEILSPTDSDEESEFILCEAETASHDQIDGAKNSAFYENPKLRFS